MSLAPPLLVIGNKNYSSWSLRPWLLLRHFHIPFEERRLALDTEQFRGEIGRWSPSGRVPVLHHAGLAIWDSLAICEYANEVFLAGRGWPGDRRARALARAGAAEMHSGFADLRSQLPMNCGRQPNAYRWSQAAERDIQRVQQLWRELRQGTASSGPFLAGSGFGIVDAMFAPVAVRFKAYGVAIDDDARAFVDAIYALPAMQDWLAGAAAEAERIEKYEAM